MNFLNYMTQPMGQQQAPMAAALGVPPSQSFASQMNPLFWAGLGMLSDSGYSRTPQGPGRGLKSAMSGVSMGSALARQEQAQQLEWAKLQSTLKTSALESEKLRWEIDEARMKRKKGQAARSILGTPGTPRELAGPPRQGEDTVGHTIEGGSGYLGGRISAPQTGALLAGLGPDYMPVARDLLKRGEPRNPKDNYISDGKGGLWDVSGPRPVNVGRPGGGGGGNGWTPEAIRKEFDLSKYKPASVDEAMRTGDINVLKPYGAYEGPNLTAATIDRFKQDYSKATDTARGGVQGIQRLFAMLEEEGGVPDVAALYSLVTALDPASVVREGEVAIVQDSLGLKEQMIALVKKTRGDGFLTKDVKEDMRRVGARMMKLYEQSYTSWTDHYRGKVLPALEGTDPAMFFGPSPNFAVPAAPDTDSAASVGSPAEPEDVMTPDKARRLRELRLLRERGNTQLSTTPGPMR